MEALLGEGMPWRIIMVFFAIGVWVGMKAERKSRFQAENTADTEGVSETDNEENRTEKTSQLSDINRFHRV
jgi:choline-glycine betaine transporter